MADTPQTTSQLQTAFADNTDGDITAQDGRNLVVSAMGLATTSDPTADWDAANTAGTGCFDSGSKVINTSNGSIWLCIAGTTGNADWIQIQTLVLDPGDCAGPTITFAAGTSGDTFNVSGSDNTITYNMPSASQTVEGSVSTGTQTLGGAKTIIPASSTDTPLTLMGVASQSSPLLVVTDDDDDMLMAVNYDGGLAVNTSVVGGQAMTMKAISTSDPTVVIQAASSQTANILAINDSSGTPVASIGPTGSLTLPPSTTNGASLNIGSGSVAPSSPNVGDVWIDGDGNLGFQNSSGTQTISGSGPSITPYTGTGTVTTTKTAILTLAANANGWHGCWAIENTGTGSDPLISVYATGTNMLGQTVTDSAIGSVSNGSYLGSYLDAPLAVITGDVYPPFTSLTLLVATSTGTNSYKFVASILG